MNAFPIVADFMNILIKVVANIHWLVIYNHNVTMILFNLQYNLDMN